MPEPAVPDRVKVLVAGDDVDVRHSVAGMLDGAPGLWVVGLVGSGTDTVGAVARLRPDVVLVDLSTSVVDALETARRIKAGTHLPKVVMVTADDSADLRERASSVSIDGYVTRHQLTGGAIAALRAAIGDASLQALFATSRPTGVRSLAEVTRVMSSGLDEMDVFQRVAASAAELIGAPIAALWIADERSRSVSLAAWSDEAVGRDWSPATLPYGVGGIGWVASLRQVQDRSDAVADDSFLLPESREWAFRHALPSALVAPVVLGNELLAVLALFSARPFDFGVDEYELLDAFTALAAATMATSRAHQEALRDRDFHRAVAEFVSEAVVATDAEGRVTYMSPRAETMFECPAGRALGRDIRALAERGEVDTGIVERIEAHLRDTGDVSRQDFTIALHGGAILEATMAVRRLRGTRGEPSGCVFVVRDVTEARNTQRSLEQAERLSVMGLLVAGVAHELSNPLQVVTGYADLLRAEAAGRPHTVARAEQIHRAASRCSRIVENFLSLARRRPPGRQMVRLNTVVQDAIDLVAYQLRLDGIDVRQDLATDLPEVWGDAHELHQLIVNLIVNARHAMRRDTGPRQLRLATRAVARGSRVIVEVADSGPGVPAALRDRIFEPFFTTAPPGEGTGLGLPLCQSIALAHGGTVSLAPTSGAGATFVVELPARPATPSADRAATSPAEKTPRQRVLVVDDEDAVGSLIGTFLEMDGHVAEVERDAERALERLTHTPFDLVLIDIHMAGMDGIAFYQRLEQVAPHLARRVIFVTGDSLTPGAFVAERGLMTLNKPFRRADLRTAVRRVMEG